MALYQTLLVLILAWLGGILNLQAKPIPYYKHFSAENGLPSQSVYNVYSDSLDAFLYLGTERGVYRYDGQQFQRIPVIGARSQAFTELGRDTQGRLWMRNFSNQAFYLERDSFRALDLSPWFGEFFNLVAVQARPQGIWLVSSKRVIRIEPKTFQIVASYKPQLAIENFQADTFGQAFWDTEGQSEVNLLQQDVLSQAIPDLDYKQTWRSTGNSQGLFALQRHLQTPLLYHFSAGKLVQRLDIEGLPKELFLNNLRYTNGRFWFCTRQGLWLFVPGQKAQGFFLDDNVSEVTEDYLGHIWVSTVNRGMYCLPNLKLRYLELGHGEKFLHYQDGQLLIQHADSIGLYETQDLQRLKVWKHPRLSNGVMLQRLGSKVYSATVELNLENGQFHSHPYTRSLAQDSKGRLYGASYRSLILWGKEVFPFPYHLEHNTYVDTALDNTIPSWEELLLGKIRALHWDETNQKLWLGSAEGLRYWDAQGLSDFCKDHQGQIINAYQFLTDSAKRLWVLSQDGELFLFQDNLLLRQIRIAENELKQMQVEGNKLYVLGAASLWSVQLDDFQVKKVFALSSLGINYVKNFALGQGQFWFSTSSGILFGELPNGEIPVPLRLHVSLFKIGGHDKHRDLKADTCLSYNENNLFVDFQALVFLSKAFYRYRLLPDTVWRDLPGENSFLSFEALAPGQYTLQIQVFDAEQGRAGQRFEQSFCIAPPFWNRPWFYLLELLSALVLASLIYQFFRRRLLRKQIYREQLLLSKLKALRAQMNPHFIYNVLNSLQGMIYSDQINEASDYISSFSKHLRQSLDFSERQSNSLRQERELLETYLELEKMRFGPEFSYTLDTTALKDEQQEIPSMILQPFVENAVKHGLLNKRGEKHLLIRFTQDAALNLEVHIQDNGIGRAAAAKLNAKRPQKPQSFATKAIASRIELLNQRLKRPIHIQTIDLEDEQARPLGTIVQVYIPHN